MKRRPALLLILLLPLLAGCFGGGSRPLPIAPGRMSDLNFPAAFEELDRTDRAAIDSQLTALQQEITKAAESKDRAVQSQVAMKRLLVGYCWERRGDLADAERAYAEVPSSEYASLAQFRLAQVAEYRASEARAQAQDPTLTAASRQEAAELAKLQTQQAVSALGQFANLPIGSRVLVREPPVASLPLESWQQVEGRTEAYRRLDSYYRTKPSYQALHFLVRLCGGGRQAPGQPKKSYPYILAIALIAVLAKLITTPLSAAQFKSMRAIQKVQPALKKIQEKYKDDKQQLARAQMELFKEHKVNPASSCLPMLIQFPILIWVYYAIRYYVYQFEGVHFLGYIKSLADPDIFPGTAFPGPLLILYMISMYFSQKLLAQPGATPEQQQQQKMLSIMMPVFLLFVLKSLPAAFILYWLLQNILMTGHQWLIMRPQRLAVAAAAAAAPGPQLAPPPEAIQKLSQARQPAKTSQGTGGGKKKRKRRREL